VGRFLTSFSGPAMLDDDGLARAMRSVGPAQATRSTAMCMNCGCGEENERHKPGDIVLDDLKKAAQNHNLEVEQVADNIHSSAKQLKDQGKIR